MHYDVDDDDVLPNAVVSDEASHAHAQSVVSGLASEVTV